MSYRVSPTYSTWKAMRRRCNNPNTLDWKYYGERGIKVCKRWDIFDNFIKDMGEKPEGMSLDRIDSDKDYSPANCKWSEAKTQSRNRRSVHRITFKGKTQGLSEWLEELGVLKSTYKNRRHLGWSLEDAVFKPVRGGSKNVTTSKR